MRILFKAKLKALRKHSKGCFLDLAVILSNTEVENWFNDDSEEDIETIKFYLTKTISGIVAEDTSEEKTLEPFFGRINFDSLKFNDQRSEIWRATHIAGRFNCEIEKIYEAEALWPIAQGRITALMRAFHPNLQRIFDLDYVPKSDCFAVCKSSSDGLNFEEAFLNIKPATS